MRASSLLASFLLTFIVVSGLAQTPTPPPLLARPRAVYLQPNRPGVAVPDLLQAVMDNDVQQVGALLQRGANPNEAFYDTSPLEWAMGSFFHTDPRIAELLLEHGAKPNVRKAKNELGQTNGWTPLFYAVVNKRSDLVAILLKHGAQVNLKDIRGKSPLDHAKEVKSDEIVKQLKAAGARDLTKR